MNNVCTLRLKPALRLLFLTAVCVLLPTTYLSLIAEDKSLEQVEFAMEGSVVRPVHLPEDALRVMRQNKTVVDCLESGQSKEAIPETWFITSEVHLSNSHEAGLVVMPRSPEGACLLNAHTMPFWILLKSGRTWTIALEDNVLVLRVLSTLSYEHRDIETTAANLNETTTWLYRFDGEKYILNKKTSIPQK